MERAVCDGELSVIRQRLSVAVEFDPNDFAFNLANVRNTSFDI